MCTQWHTCNIAAIVLNRHELMPCPSIGPKLFGLDQKQNLLDMGQKVRKAVVKKKIFLPIPNLFGPEHNILDI